MQWISISDSSLIVGICEKQSNTDTITRIYKENIINDGDSVFFQEELQAKLKEVLTSINENQLVDRHIAISLPINKIALYINKIDTGLSSEEENDILNWKLTNYLSDKKNFFFQHYPLKENENEKTFLSLVMKKNCRDILIDTINDQEFEPTLIDIGIFTAYELLQKSFPLSSYDCWGIWEVSTNDDVQNIIITQNEDIHHLSFKFNSDETATVLLNTDPEIFTDEYVQNIIDKDYTANKIDKMFVYSLKPTDMFVQKIMASPQNLVVNPLPALSKQKVQIDKKYLRDKFLLSQFVEIAGLISRQ